jgi:uncharacterized phage-associated protein
VGTLMTGDSQIAAEAVAEFFLNSVDESSGDGMTNLRLQKLVYYAQGWHLALLDEPLFPEDIQAWEHGPVVRPVYNKYKRYGWKQIPRPNNTGELSLRVDSKDVLVQVWDTYSQFSAKHLENMTHGEQPWLEAREGCADLESSSAIISWDAMRDYFRSVMNDDNRRREYAHELAYMLSPETEEEHEIVALSTSLFAEQFA